MVNGVFMVGSLCYGVLLFVHLLKNSYVSDAIWMLLLCCLIAGYFAPHIGEMWPTVESLYDTLYSPISDLFYQTTTNE